MPAEDQPSSAGNSVLATLFFTRPDKPLDYGHGFVVRFAVAPKVGDMLTVDQYSIRRIPAEALHQCDWEVVRVEHELSLGPPDVDDHPLAILRVTVHPRA